MVSSNCGCCVKMGTWYIFESNKESRPGSLIFFFYMKFPKFQNAVQAGFNPQATSLQLCISETTFSIFTHSSFWLWNLAPPLSTGHSLWPRGRESGGTPPTSLTSDSPSPRQPVSVALGGVRGSHSVGGALSQLTSSYQACACQAHQRDPGTQLWRLCRSPDKG